METPTLPLKGGIAVRFPEIFRNAFISSGIDIDRLIARAQQDDLKKRLIDLTADAVNRGAFGSPTFFVGEEMIIGKDQLCDVGESIVEQTRQPFPKRPDSGGEI